MCPVQNHFIFLMMLIMSMALVLSLTQMFVLLSFLRDVEHTSFYFGLCVHKFVLCLLGECPLSLCRCNITELSV